jgi:hypothetical protein
MKKILLLFVLNIICAQLAPAQLDTLQYRGSAEKYINLVILGDGYTAGQQDKFLSDAAASADYLFTQQPWAGYKNYFNIFVIKTPSQDSGIRHPADAGDCDLTVPVSEPNTIFGTTFDYYGIHRLVVPTKHGNIANTLATYFPEYDQVIILANTSYYGGSGGEFATSTVHEASTEITVHELGHSFGELSDEYYAGDGYAREAANMTRETDPSAVRWKAWMDFNGTGIYQHSGTPMAAEWYKPHVNCKMEYLGSPFCSVCSETIIKKIHLLVNPIVSYTPEVLTVHSSSDFLDFKITELMRPEPADNFTIVWQLDGEEMGAGEDSLRIDQTNLSPGNHTLTVSVTDATQFIRDEEHTTQNVSSVFWTIVKTASGIDVTSDATVFQYSVFPNPARDFIRFSVTTEKEGGLSVALLSLDGRRVANMTAIKNPDGEYSGSIAVEHVPHGTYTLVFMLDNVTFSRNFIKL